jgi:hypothetical protein
MSLRTKMTLAKQNSGRLQNTTGIATGAAQTKNYSSKNSSPSSPSEQQVCVTGENSKVEYTYG